MSTLLEIACNKVVADQMLIVAKPTVKDLIQLIDDTCEQLEIPVIHTFIPEKHEYWREITMPAGMTGVGHVHRHRHLNIAMTGRALVTHNGETKEVIAPAIFYSEAGAQKAFQVFEDFRFITVHENPRGWNEDHILEMEREIFELPDEQQSSDLDVNAFRMTKQPLYLEGILP